MEAAIVSDCIHWAGTRKGARHRPSLGMDHTAERIAQAAHIIRRISSHKERERIMRRLEQEGDFTAEGIEAVRRLVGYSHTMW